MPDDIFSADDFDIGDFDAADAAKRTGPARKQELSALLQKFKQSAKQEQATFMENVDSEYWCCLCFQTRAQKDEFLLKKGWLEIGDKYLDGVAVAKAEGLDLENGVPRVKKRNISKRWQALVK